MGRFSKKIFTKSIDNELKGMDAELASSSSKNKKLLREVMRNDKEAQKYTMQYAGKLKQVVRGYAHYFALWTLKHSFKFSAAQMLEFTDKVRDLYKYAYDDKSIQLNLNGIIKFNVRGMDKEAGDLCYPDYEPRKFNPSGTLMTEIQARNEFDRAVQYQMAKAMNPLSNLCEIAFMMVLHDHFGYRTKRLKRFIDTIRVNYLDRKLSDAYLENMKSLEKLCKCQLKEFEEVRNGSLAITV